MPNLARTAAVLLIAALAPTGAFAASPHATTRAVTLHATKKYQSMASFKHVMASAKLRYVKNDVTITLTADNLPMPSSIGEKVYVLFASDGATTEKVGALHGSGNMSSASGQVMMTRIQDLYVYAAPSATAKHPMGKEVLAAMVG